MARTKAFSTVRLLAAVWLLGVALPASAAPEPCSDAQSSEQLQACLWLTLRESDNRLNDVYQRQMQRGDEATRRVRRDAQRRWIGHRDNTCKVEKGIANREAWFARVRRDAARTRCIIRETLARAEALEAANASADSESRPIMFAEVKSAVFAFDDAMPTSERLSPRTSVPALAPDEEIAGEPLSRWIQRYWQWSRSFPKGETPADDSTGERCAAEQSGPVFFLTGSSQSGTVSRTCVVPKDSYILVPLINVLAQVNPGKPADCEAIMRPVRQVNASVSDLHFTLNGVVLHAPLNYRGESGCFELQDVSRGIAGSAGGAGYWVVLRPLDAGDYELRFEGKFRADGFTQDIRYRIQVQ